MSETVPDGAVPIGTARRGAPNVAGWDRFVCVDWGKALSKRRAWVAEVEARHVAPADLEPTLASLVAFARALPGRTVVAIDAALGVPRLYLEGARRAVPGWSGAESFLAWLALATRAPGALLEARSAEEWRHDRPFIRVPPGKGALAAFWKRCGGPLVRAIDVATGAKSPFVVAGIPGSVGSGSRALWSELADVRGGANDVAVWPFDGPLDSIGRRIALAEMYPRASYALALAPALPAGLMPLAKTRHAVRASAADALAASGWIRRHAVTLRQLDLARDDEDHFDAMISAAALLRCALEGHPLDEPACDAVEGGILGLPSLRVNGCRSAGRTSRRR